MGISKGTKIGSVSSHRLGRGVAETQPHNTGYERRMEIIRHKAYGFSTLVHLVSAITYSLRLTQFCSVDLSAKPLKLIGSLRLNEFTEKGLAYVTGVPITGLTDYPKLGRRASSARTGSTVYC